jgi:hypothetical protein
MNIGTLMLIIAGIAIALAAFMKLAQVSGWFWYGFFITLFVVGVFMTLVVGQAWLVARLIRRIEDHYRPELRVGGAFATFLTLVLYLLIPATVAVVAGLGTFLIVTRVMATINSWSA